MWEAPVSITDDPDAVDKPPSSDAGQADIPWVHTPFEQRWWLEAVAPGQWGEVLIERQRDVVARLPYVRKKRFGFTVLTQAPLTRFVGPWLRPPDGKPGARLGSERELMTELIAGLPRFDAYRGNFAPAVTNWLPFYWAGFEATLRYTYRFDDLSDPDRLWTDVAKSTRNHIRRAGQHVEVRTDRGVEDVLRINHKVFARQGLAVPYGDTLVHRLDLACRARGVRTVLTAVDAQDRVHAATYLVRDGTTTYMLFGGADPEFRSSGARSLLVWEAIRRAGEETRSFDFLGSMIESVERFNRSFGASQVPYLFVTRARPVARLLLAARQLATSRA
jgi:hypothetical protein